MRRFIFLAVFCIALAACTKSEINTSAFKKGQVVTISASAAMNGSTKVTGTDDGSKINFKWEEGDKILVKVGESSAEFTLTSGAGSANASFMGTLPEDAEAGDVYTVQYPVDTPDLSEQEYNGSTLPKNKMLFTGAGTLSANTAEVTLFAQYAVLQLNLYTRAESYDYNNPLTPLNGIYVDYNIITTPYTVQLIINPAKDIPTTEAEAIPFYIVVPAGVESVSATCHATISDEDKTYSLTISDKYSLEAGKCLNMAACQISWSSCLAAGTRITMADGSTKKVEDIVEGDLIRTFDHEFGCISSAKVCLAMQEEGQIIPLNLHFASGNTLTIAGQHGLIEQNSLKYVLIHSGNVQKYVGKCFYNAQSGTWDKLLNYEIGSTPVDRYAIYSANHLNVIAENMLTVEDDVNFHLNVYELDANLKADAAQLAADIAKYGIFDVARDFPEFAQYQNQMEDLGCKYIYIAIGKGLVSENYIEQMKSYWSGK